MHCCCNFAEMTPCATASVFEEQMNPTLDDDNKFDSYWQVHISKFIKYVEAS